MRLLKWEINNLILDYDVAFVSNWQHEVAQ